MTNDHFTEFHRGYWDSVQFGYVPDYNKEQMTAWTAGYMWGKSGNSEPCVEDYEHHDGVFMATVLNEGIVDRSEKGGA